MVAINALRRASRPLFVNKLFTPLFLPERLKREGDVPVKQSTWILQLKTQFLEWPQKGTTTHENTD
jgi:hypothetical protein